MAGSVADHDVVNDRAENPVIWVFISSQNNPSISPSSRRWIASAAGTRGRPGIVMMSPQIATTKPAPADSRTSRTGRMWPVGAPITVGSEVKLYCVLAMQTGTLPKPASSNAFNRRATASGIAMSDAR